MRKDKEANDNVQLTDLKQVPERDNLEAFVRDFYKADENIDMKTIYKSPVDIARLHVIANYEKEHKLIRSAKTITYFLEILKPALVSTDGIGREQAERMINGLMTKQMTFREKITSNLKEID